MLTSYLSMKGFSFKSFPYHPNIPQSTIYGSHTIPNLPALDNVSSIVATYHEHGIEIGLQSMAALDGNKDTTTHHRLKDDSTIGHLLETEVRAHVWIALSEKHKENGKIRKVALLKI